MLLGVVGILLAAAIAYIPAYSAGYIWDDDAYIVNNTVIQRPEGLKEIWTSLTVTPQFYPAVFTTFWVEHRLWGLEPAGYHAVNVGIHGIASVLVWLVLRRLGLRGAWVAGLVFAVHPVHVESVAWVTERKNTLSGMFYLMALLAYLRAFDIPRRLAAPRGMGFTAGWYAVSVGLFVLALLSKTITCSLPAVIVLILWWKRPVWRWRELIPTLPMFALGLAAARLTVWVEQHHVGAKDLELGLTPAGRVLIAGRAVWFYLGKLVWPTDLTFIYEKWVIDPGVWWQWVYPAGVVAVLAGLWVMRGRIGKGPLVAGLCFCGTLVPALGFVDVYPMRYSWVADHFQYLASVAVVGAVLNGAKRANRAKAANTGEGHSGTGGGGRRFGSVGITGIWRRCGGRR